MPIQLLSDSQLRHIMLERVTKLNRQNLDPNNAGALCDAEESTSGSTEAVLRTPLLHKPPLLCNWMHVRAGATLQRTRRVGAAFAALGRALAMAATALASFPLRWGRMALSLCRFRADDGTTAAPVDPEWQYQPLSGTQASCASTPPSMPRVAQMACTGGKFHQTPEVELLEVNAHVSVTRLGRIR